MLPRAESLIAVLVVGLGGWTGCASLPWVKQFTLPERYTLARNQLLLHSDFPLPAQHRLLDELELLRDDLLQQLALPGSQEPIHVYLFDTPERYEGFLRLHYPGFADRRALFVETDTRLVIYARWGERISEDLRHEATHGYLHSTVRNLPLWLDEGLAEYYEVGRGQWGLNRPHLDYLLAQLQRNAWQPNLPRLEALTTAEQMGQAEYAECWAWVHFLLHSRQAHRELLRRYLFDLRHAGRATPLSSRIEQQLEQPGPVLVEHLRLLGRGIGR